MATEGVLTKISFDCIRKVPLEMLRKNTFGDGVGAGDDDLGNHGGDDDGDFRGTDRWP